MNESVTKDLAVVFPGQGSQSVGMLADLAGSFSIVVDTFAEASNVLGYDLWDRVQNGPADLLNQTTCTQPAMLVAGVSVWRCWQQHNTSMPALMAGHSLGEYTALVCAESISFTDAVGLVRRRGELMQNAVPDGSGAMAAILGLDDEIVIGVCEHAAEGEVVSAVNFNSPGQVVIAGNTKAVERAMALAKEAGAKRALLLPVSVPSHCALMTEAATSFVEELQAIEVKTPTTPVIHNMDVKSHQDVKDIRASLAGQLHKPVRWVDTIQQMKQAGISTVIELGPGKVLTGLNKRIDKSLSLRCIQSAGEFDNNDQGK